MQKADNFKNIATRPEVLDKGNLVSNELNNNNKQITKDGTDKVKVRWYTGRNKYKVIEVDKAEVEAVKKVNRMTWNEQKKEDREQEYLQENGITPCSLESLADEVESICDETAVDPLEALIQKEERENLSKKMNSALAQLTKKQRRAIQLVYYNGYTQRTAAKIMQLSETSFSELLKRALGELKMKIV